MKVEKMLPEIYYEESRDFAYVGRLIEILLNYMKTGADCVGINIDSEYNESTTVELLADTLGFDSKHTYINKDLVIISSAFNELLRNKGTIKAIDLAVKLLLNSQDIKHQSDFDFCILDSEKAEIQINIPDSLSDIVLLEDLFTYILPIGVTYTFTKIGSNRTKTRTQIESNSKNTQVVSATLDSESGEYVGGIFDTDLGIVETTSLNTAGNDAPGSIYSGIVVTSTSSPVKAAENKESSEDD